MRLLPLAVLLFVSAHITNGSAQSVELSNAEVKAKLEEVWNAGVSRVSLGALTIVGGPAGDNRPHTCGSGLLNASEFNYVKNVEAAGLISVVEEQSSQQFRQGQSFSWGQMLDATTAGVSQKVVVRPTGAGQAIDVSGRLPPEQRQANCFAFRMGTFRITNVLKNEPQRRGVTDYRVVFVTYLANWTSEYRRVMAIGGTHLSDARKGISLLKHDAFAGKWQLVGSDFANADAEFTTNNVAAMLAAAK
jgi:hypothetical protein